MTDTQAAAATTNNPVVQPTIIELQKGASVIIDPPPLGTRFKYEYRPAPKDNTSHPSGWQYGKGGLIVRLSTKADESKNDSTATGSEREVTVALTYRLTIDAFRADAIEDGPESQRRPSRVMLRSRQYSAVRASTPGSKEDWNWEEYADTTSLVVRVAPKAPA